MARPRTLGPTITFRLPVELHAIAAERAEAKGMTVNEWVVTRLTDALCRQRDNEPTPAPTNVGTGKGPVTPVWKASMKT